MSRRIARMPAVVAIGVWYAAVALFANAVPHGVAEVAVGFVLLLTLGGYCALRLRRGDLIGSIAVAPILAAIAVTGIVHIPGWTVAYPTAVAALLAIGWIDHADRRRNRAAPPAQ